MLVGGIPPGYSGATEVDLRLRKLAEAGAVRRDIGRSREGRPVEAIEWRRPGRGEHSARRQVGSSDAITPHASASASLAVLLLSCLHPMEWIGLEVNLALLEEWIQVGAPPWPGEATILSVPVANPDGFARVEESVRRGRPRWVRGNAAQIDLNRNFPVGHRTRPRWLEFWPLYRPGPAPLSEPEAEAIASLARAESVDLSLSLHSFGRTIFYPPACRYRGTAASRLHREVVRRAGGPPRGYRTGRLGAWSPFFRARGTELDFLPEATGGLAYLLEVSAGGIGRWGTRRLHHPFFLFNPPNPDEEIARIVPFVQRLCRVALSGESSA